MKTYVPKGLRDAVVSRPDWPEIERRMKAAYGESWELVAYMPAADIELVVHAHWENVGGNDKAGIASARARIATRRHGRITN